MAAVMRGLQTVVTCAACGGPVHAVNVGEPAAGTHAVTIVGCEWCGQEWAVTAIMRPHGPRRQRQAVV